MNLIHLTEYFYPSILVALAAAAAAATSNEDRDVPLVSRGPTSTEKIKLIRSSGGGARRGRGENKRAASANLQMEAN